MASCLGASKQSRVQNPYLTYPTNKLNTPTKTGQEEMATQNTDRTTVKQD